MIRPFLLAAVATVLTIAPASAEDRIDTAPSTAGGATPVKLISWDGDFELMKASQRMRIWRSHLAYRLTVDPQGEVTDCELTESFRLRRVSESLCEILSEHHTFQPALDATGAPVEGTYSARISYAEMRERL